jgi:hypothetical protein
MGQGLPVRVQAMDKTLNESHGYRLQNVVETHYVRAVAKVVPLAKDCQQKVSKVRPIAGTVKGTSAWKAAGWESEPKNRMVHRECCRNSFAKELPLFNFLAPTDKRHC